MTKLDIAKAVGMAVATTLGFLIVCASLGLI
jgi:predicted nucleic acid-binding protein